ncbi:uncharacterized protein [Haliotis cracherodii]|uniref:uncharacterized protein n=1 Tax=Haliotis cracherodii TaxID=6455 RepID=UPI0039EB40F3
MLRQVILCVSVVCLSVASPVGQGSTPPPDMGKPIKPLSAEDFVKGVTSIMSRADDLMEDIELVKEAVAEDVEEKDWKEVARGIGKMMKKTQGMFTETLFGVADALKRLFEGDHGFKHVTRCNRLTESVQDPEFGNETFLPKLERAIEDDLTCTSFLIEDAFSWDVEKIGSGHYSEEDAVQELARTLVDLFRLRNDGMRLHDAIVAVTKAYDLRDHYMSALESKEELVRQLLRSLTEN